MVKSVCLVSIAIYLVQCVAGDVYCNKDEAAKDWKLCERAYLANSLNSIDIDPVAMCNNIDCFIQCMFDAVGDCTKSDVFLDKFMNHDPEKMKVYYRIACADISFVEGQVKGSVRCDTDDSLCNSTMYASRLLHGKLNLYDNGKYDEYKELLCNVSTQTRACIRVIPSVNCSADSAMIYFDMIKVGSSLSFCPNTDIDNLFKKYSGGVTCPRPKLDSHCFKSSLMSRISKCETLTLSSILDKRLPPRIDNYCKVQECNIKCYEDALRGCSEKDEHLEMDVVSMRVANRVACENLEELKKAVGACDLRDGTCYTDYKQSLLEAQKLKAQLNYTAYSSAVCTATSEFFNCVDFVVTGDCTDEMATLMKDIVTVLLDYARCGSQDHVFFSKYGRDTNCATSGSEKYVINMFPLILLSFIIYFQFV
ncbi:uncharacterized protein LOC132744133 [Ruditapes philippinarum]|uniref:uncharacterized protein LOC132744133 n=1 Tax=Ruditapes philippinarum TaxID=129788 RepID=UPI00295A9F22|nr:uncharacterized protein LOC132744133 [Ruditapes philippinarum]